MSINSEELNTYYNKVGELVDEYVEKWKIRPSQLRNYLKPGSKRFNKFLERNKLTDIKGSDIILKDVIEDRYNMEVDGIYTFESFKYFESSDFKIDNLKEIIYKGIEKSDIEIEKKLSDYFDVNLSSIDIIDSNKHLFKINDWHGDDWNVICYNNDDLEVIKLNLVEKLLTDLTNSKIELSTISISLDDLIDFDSAIKKINDIITEEKLIQIISKITEFDYKDHFNNTHIWVR
jgi:predicted DNA-binding protein (UPF0251 family)